MSNRDRCRDLSNNLGNGLLKTDHQLISPKKFIALAWSTIPIASERSQIMADRPGRRA